MKLFQKKYKNWSDEELMQALSKGDKRAFDELYDRYANPLLHYFTRMLWKDKEKAEDLLHDIFTKLIHKPELFDASRNFKTWIYSVANNMCKNEYKKAEVRKNTNYEVDTNLQVKSTTDIEHQVHESMFENTYRSKIESLDHKHKEVFSLRHEDGLSIKEIASILDINEGTVKSRLFYATKQLAELLREFNPITNR